jgi:hypothetical protein
MQAPNFKKAARLAAGLLKVSDGGVPSKKTPSKSVIYG